MPTLNAGDFVEDEKYGSGRVIYVKGANALVEYTKSAPQQLLPGVWSIPHKMTIRKTDGTKKHVLDHSSFGREDHCWWYDRYKNNLKVVQYPDRIKRSQRAPKTAEGKILKQTINGNNNIQAAGDVVVKV